MNNVKKGIWEPKLIYFNSKTSMYVEPGKVTVQETTAFTPHNSQEVALGSLLTIP
jgi:hypothetical protein